MKLNWCAAGLLILAMVVPALGQDGKKPLSLDDCIRIALDQNVSILTYRNLAESAGNNVRGSYSNILPTVSTSWRGQRTTEGPSVFFRSIPVYDSLGQVIDVRQQEVANPKQTFKFYSFNFDISQPIYDGGNWWNQIRKSKADRQASDYDLNVQINTTIKEVAQYYVDLVKQEKLLEVNRLAEQRSQDNLDKTQKMFEIGSVAKVDVFRARVNLGNDRISVLNQGNIVQQARQRLNIVMGRDPNATISIEKDFEYSYDLPELDALVESAFANHPELKRRSMEVRSQEMSVKIAKSAFLPTVAGFFNYNRGTSTFSDQYDPLDQNWNTTIGATVRLNLFNGFSDQVNYQNAKIARRNTELAIEDYRRQLKSTITALYDSYRNQLEVIEINRENLEASREEYRLANERYRLGAGTSLDIREAQVNLTEAERLVVAAEYDLILTFAELQDAIGRIQEAF